MTEAQAEATWDFAEGTEIATGRTTLRRLGTGNVYETYLVWDDRLFAIVVAKLLRPHLVADEHALRGLRREAEALERLAHPVVVRGFDTVLDGPHPHVVLEHLEGPSLRRLIKRAGALPVEQVLPLALHVASALHYIAAEGMVHLDVKPDNVIMGVPPRLIDLSIARSIESAGRLSSPLGTDAYMAPEQCDPVARGPVGAAADVFGLAATVYHAVAGKKPFPRDAEAPESRWPQLVNAPEPLPGAVDPVLRDLLAAGLAADPAARPTAAEFALALEPLVAALPQRARFSRRGPG